MSTSDARYEAVLAQIATDLVSDLQRGEAVNTVVAMGDDAPTYVDELLSWAIRPWREPGSPKRGVAALILANRDLLRGAATRASA